MKFIKVTYTHGGETFINANMISTIQRRDGGGSYITVDGAIVAVAESPETILVNIRLVS